MARDVFVEVDGEVFLGDAPVGAEQPGLEVRDRAVRAGKEGLRANRGALAARLMAVALARQSVVAIPAVGVNDRARRRGRLDERVQRRLGGIGERRET